MFKSKDIEKIKIKNNFLGKGMLCEIKCNSCNFSFGKFENETMAQMVWIFTDIRKKFENKSLEQITKENE